VLLIASGLMVRTFVAMRGISPGFTKPEDVLTLRVSIPEAVVADPAQVVRTYEQIARNIAALGGVAGVGLSSSVSMNGSGSSDPVFVEDFPQPEGQIPTLRRFKWVGDGYIETMGNTLIAGRTITWSDVYGRAPVVMVSENLAREFWGEPSKAIGRRIRQSPKNPWREIIGVVAGEHPDGVTKPAPEIVYWPMLMQDFWDDPVFVQRSLVYSIRTSRLSTPGFLNEVQRAVWSVNANLPLANVRTLREIYDDSMAQTSFTLVILGIAAGVTLLLGIVGIYGVIAYVVAQRRREVGIRMALGAAAGEVQRLFLRHGTIVAGIGLLIGAAASAALMKLIGSLLFGVSPFDPVTYAASLVTLGLIALLATWVPARQATRIDPSISLRG
jgi:predicted permease